MRLHQNLSKIAQQKLFSMFFSIVLVSPVKHQGFAGQTHSVGSSAAVASPALAPIKEWFAFGSGCKGSSKAGNGHLKTLNGSGDSLKAHIRLDEFNLNVPAGGSGVRECAVRLTVEPPDGLRLKDIGVKAQIQARKVDSVQLRSRVLLLVGDRLLARQEWNLEPSEFARYRNHDLYLVPGKQAEMSLPQMPCGKAQIVGLDLTFEGLTHPTKTIPQPAKEDSFLRLVPGSVAEIEIFFEKCR